VVNKSDIDMQVSDNTIYCYKYNVENKDGLSEPKCYENNYINKMICAKLSQSKIVNIILLQKCNITCC